MTVAPATKNVDAYFFGLYSTNNSGNCFFNASTNRGDGNEERRYRNVASRNAMKGRAPLDGRAAAGQLPRNALLADAPGDASPKSHCVKLEEPCGFLP